MGLRLVIDDVRALAVGVWNLNLQPSEVQRLGGVRNSAGGRSILLIDNAIYDEASRTLGFDASSVRVLNLGTSPDTVAVASLGSAQDASVRLGLGQAEPNYGAGDLEFLSLVEKRLRGTAASAAKELLRRIRGREAGDLQRGQRLNFKNTPDNFWYVIVQPTVQALSITVRGRPSSFDSVPGLALVNDRPGYTRFKLTRPDQVEGALRTIWSSRRR